MSDLRNTLKLLRFPFSVFLLPVSLFSLYFIKEPNTEILIGVLAIWHILVYPSSNGYNSYHDQDEGPIGGMEKPPKPSKSLLYAANVMDSAAILLSFLINWQFALGVALYILFSRLYSHRAIRLKKYPLIGFLVVFVFQGAWVFASNALAFGESYIIFSPYGISAALASSFLIGTVYPLTQIYQHEADRKDGVLTLSMLLGIKGTFLFSGSLFGIATSLLAFTFFYFSGLNDFWLFMIILTPATIYFFYWAIRCFINPDQANFKNTMVMLVLSSMLNNIYFLTLLFQ